MVDTIERCARAIAEVLYPNWGWNDLRPVYKDKCQQSARACVAAQWISTSDRLPEKPGKEAYEYVECLIFHRGEIKLRPWNCEHLVWDDEDHDDFFCEAAEPTHWMPLPEPAAVLEGKA